MCSNKCICQTISEETRPHVLPVAHLPLLEQDHQQKTLCVSLFVEGSKKKKRDTGIYVTMLIFQRSSTSNERGFWLSISGTSLINVFPAVGALSFFSGTFLFMFFILVFDF